MTYMPSRLCRDLLQQDLGAFVHRAFLELNPASRFEQNWHLEVLAAKLEEVRSGKCKRLIVNIPPRHLKSHTVSIAFVAWLLGHDPAKQILAISYAQDLSDKLARDCRALMTSEFYQALFDTRLRHHRDKVEWPPLLRVARETIMKKDHSQTLRCAIYTRVSTDAGLEQDFNSLDAQREASEAYIKSQSHEGWKLIKTAYDDGGFSGGSLDRPALQKLLADIKAGLVDVIVVYKVDRLTRSLADFAKLVEQFDAHGVSFVSVTQSFNTTTSMGRLTLNMLLSFAQFEREVTSERIRDKVAASKKKGMWMGGSVPLGYRVENRKLLVIPEEADTVQTIFRCYLEQGSILKLLEELRAKRIRSKRRIFLDDRMTGGIPFTPGPITYLLKNRIYIGEIVHKGTSYPGEHAPILDRVVFEAVQARLTENLNNHHAKRAASNALLLGKLFDDAGNVMSPTHCRKNGIRYRYYTSRAFIEGRKKEVGAVPRVAADEVETAVVAALKEAGATARPVAEDSDTERAKTPKQKAAADTSMITETSSELRDQARALIQAAIVRIVIEKGRLAITLTDAAAEAIGQTALSIPWTPRPKKPRRDLILPVISTVANLRPMHAERRAKHLRAIALGRKWLEELVSGKVTDVSAIAIREGRSTRSVHMTISLAFIAPDIVEAAVAGRLPRGIGVMRLVDLPPSWTKQKETLGLPARF